MATSLQALFEDTAELADEEAELMSEAELAAEVPSESEMCVAVVRENEIIIQFAFTNPFNESYYIRGGIAQPEVESGQVDIDKHNWIAMDAFSDNCYINMRTEAEMIEEYLTQNEDDSYTVYGFAQAANGKHYPISIGSPVTFWVSEPRVRVRNVGSSTCDIVVTNLEQTLSEGNYAAIGFTAKPFLDGYNRLMDENGNSVSNVDAPLSYSNSRNITFKMSGLPQNRTFSLYLYKKTWLGYYYLIKEIEITTTSSEDSAPSCFLECKWEDNYILDGSNFSELENTNHTLKCYKYPRITADNWNQFCVDINTVRKKANYTEWVFTKVESGNKLSANLFKELYDAIKDICPDGIIIFPEISPLKSRYEITPNIISTFIDVLQDCVDYYYK